MVSGFFQIVEPWEAAGVVSGFFQVVEDCEEAGGVVSGFFHVVEPWEAAGVVDACDGGCSGFVSSFAGASGFGSSFDGASAFVSSFAGAALAASGFFHTTRDPPVRFSFSLACTSALAQNDITLFQR